MRKLMLFFIIMGILLIGGGYFWYTQMGNQQASTETVKKVALTERFSTPEQWQEFNQKWQTFKSDDRNTWENYVTFAQGEGARYDCSTAIMTVGEETLYGCDLNALFVLMDYDTYSKPGTVDAESKEFLAVIDGLVIDSAFLQEASKHNYVTLNNLFYNALQKNTLERFSQLKTLRDNHQFDADKTFDFEAVVIYFFNQIPPKNLAVEKAKQIALQKMQILYPKIKNGELTMEQAGAQIKADTIDGDTTGVSLSELDTLYPENAYVTEKTHLASTQFFKDSRMDDVLKKLKKDEVSDIFLCKDYAFTQKEAAENPNKEFPLVDSCYAILKVTNVSNGFIPENSEFQSLDEYLLATYKPKTETKK